ncbi:reverse transcriptase domain-containing protein, partial [Tanacetum coccineum]
DVSHHVVQQLSGQPSCGAQLIFPSKQGMTSKREEVECAAAPGGDSPLNASSTTGTGIGTFEDAEFRLEQCERGWIQDRARIRRLEEHLGIGQTMSTTQTEMSSAEIDQIVAQRVTDAIEAIAIYETKIRMAHVPVNQVIRQETTIGKNANNKRKWESDHRRNSGRAREMKWRKLHHAGPCTVKCGNCKRVGHMTRNCKAPVASTSQRAHVANKKAVITCYECEGQGHFRNECPKLSNQNQVNQNRKEKAHENTSTVADNANA